MSQFSQILALLESQGTVRPKDLTQRGLSRHALRPLMESGKVLRVARGLYMLAEADVTENASLVEASLRVPHAVVCLLSALRFHELGTQNPHQVWLAIDRKARRPAAGQLPLRFMRFSGQALSEGVETHEIQGVPVRIYCAAKTVADCFKFRNKTGLDVALEALREGWRGRCFTMDELWGYAKIDRVSNVIRPYLEALD